MWTAPLIDYLLLAANEDGAATANNPLAVLQPLLIFAPIVLLYIFLVHRPQKREQAQRMEMINQLKKNDHVLMTSGIYGVVTNVNPDTDEITVRVDESNNTRLRMTRAAIARVVSDSPGDKIEKQEPK